MISIKLLIFFSIFITPIFSTSSPQINSNSILVSLLDSRYTELSELIEKALLLHTLESTLNTNNTNITIFAPRNEALDPNFKRFLLQPCNLHSLQNLLLSHIVPHRIELNSSYTNLGQDYSTLGDQVFSGAALVVHPNDVVRPDGVIHGIERLLVPESVQQEFNRRRSLRDILAVKPEGAPGFHSRTRKPLRDIKPGSPPVLPIYEAMAPGPSLAPAPAPGPGGSHRHFDGEKQVKGFIQTLLLYGGYNEMADILVNLTSLASEMGRLVSEGYVITVLAPNDEAMAKLTSDMLSEPGEPERIVYYHIIPEYQTEESMYNSVRRFGKVRYDTLRVPHKVVAQEADGSVKFGDGEMTVYLFDPDIYTDGRISVQGIDGVLVPPVRKIDTDKNVSIKVAKKPRRGRLLEVTCSMVGLFLQDLRFAACQ